MGCLREPVKKYRFYFQVKLIIVFPLILCHTCKLVNVSCRLCLSSLKEVSLTPQLNVRRDHGKQTEPARFHITKGNLVSFTMHKSLKQPEIQTFKAGLHMTANEHTIAETVFRDHSESRDLAETWPKICLYRIRKCRVCPYSIQ